MFAGRVYPFIGVQGGTTPFVIYDVSSVRPEGSKDAGSHIDIIDVNLTMIGVDYGVLQQAVSDVRTTFVRMKETIEGVNVASCSFDTQSDAFNVDEETFGVEVDLSFRVVIS